LSPDGAARGPSAPDTRTPAVSRLGLLVVAPLAVFLVLAPLAAGADGRLAGDGAVIDVLNLLAPVSSDDVHVDPFLDATALSVSALVALLVLSLIRSRELGAAAFLVLAITLPVMLGRIAKQVVERPAIEGPRDEYSFPSGSATWCAATVAALMLVAGSARERRVLALAGVPLVLVYGAVIAWEEWHHPSDVLAGWCLAVACAATAWLAMGRPAAAVLPSLRRRRVAS
jgi:membrane-associated phospholipid phosphatase